MNSASESIDEKIRELGDWRGEMLAKVRGIIREADSEIVEEWKWMGTPVWSHGGIVCTGETYKSIVKMTFAKGAALPDPCGLFNSSLTGNTRRAIDIHKDDQVDEAALKDLIRAAVALNPPRSLSFQEWCFQVLWTAGFGHLARRMAHCFGNSTRIVNSPPLMESLRKVRRLMVLDQPSSMAWCT